MRLIDADALKKAMDGYWGTCQRIRKPRNGETAVFLDVRATVEKQPIIDAVPVRHGKWIYGEDRVAMCDGYRCSNCGYFVPWDYQHKFISYIEEYKYCPECGARMEGGRDEPTKRL